MRATTSSTRRRRTGRGNYRYDLFATPGAARAFQRCIFEACGRFSWRLHAYVIMRNHFHPAVQTPEPNLSLGKKWLQGTWAVRFNRRRGHEAIQLDRRGALRAPRDDKAV